MRKMLYMTVPATMLLSSCAQLPLIFQGAEYAIEEEKIILDTAEKANLELKEVPKCP